jgi:phosphomevalonate kinase
MNTTKITVTVVDNNGYQTIKSLHFPQSWTLEQREQFISNKELVEKVNVHIYECDLGRFRNNLSHEDVRLLDYLDALDDPNEWSEARDFHEARGDV